MSAKRQHVPLTARTKFIVNLALPKPAYLDIMPIPGENDVWREEFLGRTDRLLELIATGSAWDEHPFVKRHLREGYGRRLMMIETAVLYCEALKQRTLPLAEPVKPHETVGGQLLVSNLLHRGRVNPCCSG